MNARELLQAGKLDEAIQAVSAEVRDNPQDVKRRTFLFELLCFAGDFSRAEKHLDLAAQGNQSAEMGGLLYHAALTPKERATIFSASSSTPGRSTARDWRKSRSRSTGKAIIR